MQEELKHIVESLLFVADEPLTMDKLRTLIDTADGKQIRAALQALAEEYEQRGGGFQLREVAGGWQMRSRPEYHEWIKRLLQPAPHRLSRAALETLALIAYKQPIIRADIEHIRGVDCGGVLRQLMERKLIRVLGRKEIAGRPLIYATTKLFLEMFDLKDLSELPSPMEISEFSGRLDQSQVDTSGGFTPHQADDDAIDAAATAASETDADADVNADADVDIAAEPRTAIDDHRPPAEDAPRETDSDSGSKEAIDAPSPKNA